MSTQATPLRDAARKWLDGHAPAAPASKPPSKPPGKPARSSPPPPLRPMVAVKAMMLNGRQIKPGDRFESRGLGMVGLGLARLEGAATSEDRRVLDEFEAARACMTPGRLGQSPASARRRVEVR